MLTCRGITRLLCLLLLAICIGHRSADARAPDDAAREAAAAAAARADVEGLSAAELEQFIYAPAREELEMAAKRRETTSQQMVEPSHGSKQVSTRTPSASPSLPLVSLQVSGDTPLGSLCQHLPLSSTATQSSMALAHLTQLLRSFWMDSGLLQAGASSHVLRVSVLESQLHVVSAALRASDAGAGGSATAGSPVLREEDLPEVFEATRGVLQTLTVDLAAEARLDGHNAMLDALADEEYVSHTWWGGPLRLLIRAGLYPNGKEEMDAFWAMLKLVGAGVACAGTGFWWGHRSQSGSLAGAVQGGLHRSSSSSRSSVRRNRALLLFWLFLGACVVGALMLIAGIRQAYDEEHHRLLTLKMAAEQRGPPRGCTAEDAPSVWTEWYRSWFHKGPGNDPCFVYLHSIRKGTKPDWTRVAITYLTQNLLAPFVLVAGALGEAMHSFLDQHGYLTQAIILVVLPLASLTIVVFLVVWLAGPAALRFLCCCCGSGRDPERGYRNNHRDRRSRVRDADARSLPSARDIAAEMLLLESERGDARSHASQPHQKQLRNNDVTSESDVSSVTSDTDSDESKRRQQRRRRHGDVPRIRAAAAARPRDDDAVVSAYDSDDASTVRSSHSGGSHRSGDRSARSHRHRARSRSRHGSRSRHRSPSRSPRKHAHKEKHAYAQGQQRSRQEEEEVAEEAKEGGATPATHGPVHVHASPLRQQPQAGGAAERKMHTGAPPATRTSVRTSATVAHGGALGEADEPHTSAPSRQPVAGQREVEL